MTPRRPTVSVCMATYNGEAYVSEQIESILPQLGEGDELVVVDDASSDGTVAIVRAIDDARIRLIRLERNVGYVRAFEQAIATAQGEILMFSDQDDVWTEGRIDALTAALQSGAVAASNLELLPSRESLRSPLTGRPWRLRADASDHGFRNVLKVLVGDAPYYGCAMAMRREFREVALPFPEYLVESHDLWIAVSANVNRTMRHVEFVTILRRLHDANASPSRPRGVRSVIRSRLMLLRAVGTASARRRSLRRRRAQRPKA
jgi:glycosyltransferase involved in cell wall biosynthesis